ncbi:MAG: fibronectin type III domain-containing protein [Rhodospirillaceae bacterium]|nr:fibronectin type III domain-containing protein [Rhodospirillaceae bacterium]
MAQASIPVSVVAIVVSGTSVRLQWIPGDDVAGVTTDGWDVQYKLSSASDWTDWTTLRNWGPTGRAAVITGLTTGSAYNFRVRTSASVGEDSEWVQRNATVATRVNRVRSLVPTPGDGEITVTWVAPAPVPGATVSGYRIAYRLGRTGGFTTDAEVAASVLTHTVTGLTNDEEYSIAVTALATPPALNSGISLVRSTPSGGAPTPNPPTGLQASQATLMTIAVSWTAPAAQDGITVTHYIVEWRRNTVMSWEMMTVTAPATAATITLNVPTNEMPEGTWLVRVRSVTNTDPSAYTDTVSVMVMPQPMLHPVRELVGQSLVNKVLARWQAPLDAPEGVTYKLAIRDWPHGSFGADVTTTNLSHEFATPDATTGHHEVRVVASATGFDDSAPELVEVLGGAGMASLLSVSVMPGPFWVDVLYSWTGGPQAAVFVITGGETIYYAPDGTLRHGGLTPETLYGYTLYLIAGHGAQSAHVSGSFTTPEPRPIPGVRNLMVDVEEEMP